MKGRYSEAFKKSAVSLVLEQGYSVQQVSSQQGVSEKTLYNWLAKARSSLSGLQTRPDSQISDEVERLKAELRKVTQERDILKEASVFLSVESEKNTHL